jgi:hypothetical protein
MRLLGLQVACSGSREAVGAPVVDAQGACVGAVFQRGGVLSGVVLLAVMSFYGSSFPSSLDVILSVYIPHGA